MRSARNRGTTAVEFALIMAFVFPFVLAAIVETSFYAYERSVLLNAVRVGCKAGARIHPDGAYGPTATAVTQAYLRNRGFRCPPTGCIENVLVGGVPPIQTLQCTMTVPYSSILGLVPVMENLPMTASDRVIFERQR